MISRRGVGAGLAPPRSDRRALPGDGWLPRSPARGLAACPPCGTLRLALPQQGFRAQFRLPCARTHLAAVSPAMSRAGSHALPGPQPPGALDGGEKPGKPRARAGTCHHSVSCGLMPAWRGSSSPLPGGSRGEAACDVSFMVFFGLFLLLHTGCVEVPGSEMASLLS